MTRLLVVSIVCLSFTAIAGSFSGCASSGHRVANPDQTPVSADARTQESKVLSQKVAAIHVSSMIDDRAGRLFNDQLAENFSAGFERKYCTEISSAECAQKINRAIFTALSERYFAADPVVVQNTCMAEPLICDDLNALETLYQHAHNASIAESEKEKLNLIGEWKSGKLSDDQLKAGLHLDFQFQNGKLVKLTPRT